ncbi:RNA polymerase sigma factor [Streptomyces griseorubiginosus]|uniref:RNA polymerase sigma factor 70 region 4 type 2 domain-containing protein n=1 Tax=Streptomyces griseorubiginosus TaxID=67304 RepID=A0A101RMT5_9ACTN|nr:sigma-70 family RNA polymerase sigma factor [Streptomyces griseorubiginosus]KUN58447.1 hypothetical protein AQJ54_42035 [Streptomyces griseorubiginosus]
MNDSLHPSQPERSPLPSDATPSWALSGDTDADEDSRAQLEMVDQLGSKLYGLYPNLCVVCRRKGLSHHDSEEAAMEAIRRVLTAMSNGKKPISLKLYTFAALFKVIGEFKGAQKGGMTCSLDEAPEPVAVTPVPVRLPDDSTVHDLLKVLTPRQKDVYLMRLVGQKTNAEIAEELGISPATVGVHVYNAQLRLSIYEDEDEDEGPENPLS